MTYNDPENVPPVWQVGDVILDRYEVKQVFTGGGMGLVYRVHHRGWAKDLAVKSPRPEFFQTQQHIEVAAARGECTERDVRIHHHRMALRLWRREVLPVLLPPVGFGLFCDLHGFGLGHLAARDEGRETERTQDGFDLCDLQIPARDGHADFTII